MGAYDPIAVYVLMVKNEGAVIQPTLQTFIRDKDSGAPVDLSKLGFFIFDTGSTDNTVEQARAFFEKNHIENAVVVQEPEWGVDIHYANARNRGLALAEQAFPNACFLIMPDAEWYLKRPDIVLKFCEEHQHEQGRHYTIRIMDADTGIDFYTQRVIRSHQGVHFLGKKHETIHEQPDKERVPGECYFTWSPTRYGKDKSKKRLLSDRDDLLKEYNEKHDARSCFYLGQVCTCLDDIEGARFWYEQRTRMLTDCEELFLAHYRLAQIYRLLGRPWEESLERYLLAVSIMQDRSPEPLTRIAEHYYEIGNMEKCFFFAYQACFLPYPTNRVLFVEKKIYDFHRYDLLARVAGYVGAYAIGNFAVHKALEIHPEYIYLQELAEKYQNLL